MCLKFKLNEKMLPVIYLIIHVSEKLCFSENNSNPTSPSFALPEITRRATELFENYNFDGTLQFLITFRKQIYIIVG